MSVLASVTPERQFRGPGCDPERCRALRVIQPGVFGRQELFVHDAVAHEDYGRKLAGDAAAGRHVETGLLVIDRARLTLLVDGRAVKLTPTEWRIILVLAERLDCVVSYDGLIRAVWPDWTSHQLSERDAAHLVNVHVARLRAKLGVGAGGLIATMHGFGRRLRVWPLGMPSPAWKPGGALLDGRWSHRYDACRACGTTARPHRAHGFCAAAGCRSAGRRQGYAI